MYCLCRNILCLIFLINLIQGVKIPANSLKNSKDNQIIKESDKSTNDAQPVLFDLSGGQLEEELNEAINENEQQLISLTNNQLYEENEQRLMDMTGGFLEEQLDNAIKDDAQVPSSLDNSLIDQFSTDDFEPLSLLDLDLDQESKYLKLDKVATDTIPSGITTQDYSISDKIKIIELYQSNKIEDLKELFEFIAQNIHNKYRNCVSNLGKWLTNPQLEEPIFYRNCVPCTNAVDLNFQSLFNQEINLNKLKHYFVNTCEMGKEWISYISDMEYLSVDLKRHPTTTFTDVIRQNLIPNQRYVFQGIVKSERRKNHKGFVHVCNLINDEYGHIWIIDGQIQKVFDLNQQDDIKQLDQKYRPDYLARASTGLFKPPTLIQHLKHR